MISLRNKKETEFGALKGLVMSRPQVLNKDEIVHKLLRNQEEEVPQSIGEVSKGHMGRCCDLKLNPVKENSKH